MKNIIYITLSCIALLAGNSRSYGQVQELEQLTLDIEKLTQFKSILSDMKNGYQVLSGGYNTVKNISAGNFSLHENFLDGLMAISPSLQHYKRVADIVNMQLQIIHDYKAAFNRYNSSKLFTAPELSYITKVHEGLVKDCAQNIDELFTIITAGQLRMSDAQRINAIDRLYNSMLEKRSFLSHFSSTNHILLLQRQKQINNNNLLQTVYGIK